MRHLDEGRIQAWLDRERSGIGAEEREAVEAHLDACPACAGLADELAELTTRSRSLLAVEPHAPAEPPAFTEVVARAGRLERSGRRRRIWTGAAWAASVLIALGIGWGANDLVRGGRAVAVTAESGRVTPTEDRSTRAEAETASPAEHTPPPNEAATVTPREDTPPATPAEPISPTRLGRAVQEPTGERSVVAEAPPPVIAPPVPAPDAAPSGRPTTFEDPRPLPIPEPTPGATTFFDASPDLVVLRSAPLVLEGEVTSEEGSPLESVQVYVAGTSMGALTRADGRFSIRLDDGVPAGVGAGPLTLRAEIIGFRRAESDLALGDADTVSVEFRLQQQALGLDEIVVTGTGAEAERERRTETAGASSEVTAPEASAQAPLGLHDITWSPTTRAGAEAEAGFTLRSLPDRPIVSVWSGLADREPVVRVVQTLENGGTLVLYQARREVRPDESVRVEGQAVASRGSGDSWITAIAPLSADSLQALLERMR
jgi:hypothetical protein